MKPTKKQIDNRINQAYKQTCEGVQISVLDIGKVFAVGKTAIDGGANEEQLKEAIRAFVETIQQSN